MGSVGLLAGRPIDCVLGANRITATKFERSNRRGDQTRADKRRHTIHDRQDRVRSGWYSVDWRDARLPARQVPSSESQPTDRSPNDSSRSRTTNRLKERNCFQEAQRFCSRSAAARRHRRQALRTPKSSFNDLVPPNTDPRAWQLRAVSLDRARRLSPFRRGVRGRLRSRAAGIERIAGSGARRRTTDGIATGALRSSIYRSHFAISDSGTLVYVPGIVAVLRCNGALLLLDRAGSINVVEVAAGSYRDPACVTGWKTTRTGLERERARTCRSSISPAPPNLAA